jgi:hypothetical protein
MRQQLCVTAAPASQSAAAHSMQDQQALMGIIRYSHDILFKRASLQPQQASGQGQVTACDITDVTPAFDPCQGAWRSYSLMLPAAVTAQQSTSCSAALRTITSGTRAS